MNKTNKILIFAVIVLTAVVVVLGGIYYWQKFGSQKTYYAVYLDTGDLYFGELSTFPHWSLSNVWYLQRNSQGNSSLAQFSKSPWGPDGTIQLNKDKIVWSAKISDMSQLIPYLNGTASEINNSNQQSGTANQPTTNSNQTAPTNQGTSTAPTTSPSKQ